MFHRDRSVPAPGQHDKGGHPSQVTSSHLKMGFVATFHPQCKLPLIRSHLSGPWKKGESGGFEGGLPTWGSATLSRRILSSCVLTVIISCAQQAMHSGAVGSGSCMVGNVRWKMTGHFYTRWRPSHNPNPPTRTTSWSYLLKMLLESIAKIHNHDVQKSNFVSGYFASGQMRYCPTSTVKLKKKLVRSI